MNQSEKNPDKAHFSFNVEEFTAFKISDNLSPFCRIFRFNNNYLPSTINESFHNSGLKAKTKF